MRSNHAGQRPAVAGASRQPAPSASQHCSSYKGTRAPGSYFTLFPVSGKQPEGREPPLSPAGRTGFIPPGVVLRRRSLLSSSTRAGKSLASSPGFELVWVCLMARERDAHARMARC